MRPRETFLMMSSAVAFQMKGLGSSNCHLTSDRSDDGDPAGRQSAAGLLDRAAPAAADASRHLDRIRSPLERELELRAGSDVEHRGAGPRIPFCPNPHRRKPRKAVVESWSSSWGARLAFANLPAMNEPLRLDATPFARRAPRRRRRQVMDR